MKAVPRRTPGANFTQSWQALIALAAVEALELLLSDALTLRGLTPSDPTAEWAGLLLSFSLFTASLVCWLAGSRIWTRRMMIAFTGWVTTGLVFNVLALVITLPARMGEQGGLDVLRDAVVVWLVNVLIFALWYWLVDGGGLEMRSDGNAGRRDLVFPQQANVFPDWPDWKPTFLDYLFLAFNNSTAFSPTDTFILSARVKLMTMVQATVSLTVLAMLAAYGINVLAG
jgi:hypothetical protein